MFAYKAHDVGGTKFGANKKHYSTVQAVLNECTCKYEYEDNGMCQVLLNSLEWVNHNLGAGPLAAVAAQLGGTVLSYVSLQGS